MIDFIIAGAGKSGTTSLAKLLEQHPRVCFSKIKEPCFFTEIRESEIFPSNGTFKRGFDWYNDLFNLKNCIKGEASTIYFTTPDTPMLLRKYAPNVKLIFIFRNPVDRFYAHYWQERKTRSIKKPLTTLFKENNKRLERYYANSFYKKNLTRFKNVFGKDSIKILIFEEFVNDSGDMIEEVFDFLGLKPLDKYKIPKKNTSSIPKINWIQDIIYWSKNYYKDRFLPESLRILGGQILRYIKNKNLRQFNYPDIDSDIEQMLYNKFDSDIKFVENLIGRKIASWNKKNE